MKDKSTKPTIPVKLKELPNLFRLADMRDIKTEIRLLRKGIKKYAKLYRVVIKSYDPDELLFGSEAIIDDHITRILDRMGSMKLNVALEVKFQKYMIKAV